MSLEIAARPPLSTECKRAIIKGLREIAAGAPIGRPYAGICMQFGPDRPYSYLNGCVFSMYQTPTPISGLCELATEYGDPGMWEGERGAMRRTVAGFMACWLEDELEAAQQGFGLAPIPVEVAP
jgi:hypothetical protein